MWTGWVGNDGTAGGPVITNAEVGYDWSTYPERLQRAGISWKVYQDAGVEVDPVPQDGRGVGVRRRRGAGRAERREQRDQHRQSEHAGAARNNLAADRFHARQSRPALPSLGSGSAAATAGAPSILRKVRRSTLLMTAGP
jgi:phospholipase C